MKLEFINKIFETIPSVRTIELIAGPGDFQWRINNIHSPFIGQHLKNGMPDYYHDFSVWCMELDLSREEARQLVALLKDAGLDDSYTVNKEDLVIKPFAEELFLAFPNINRISRESGFTFKFNDEYLPTVFRQYYQAQDRHPDEKAKSWLIEMDFKEEDRVLLSLMIDSLRRECVKFHMGLPEVDITRGDP